MDTPYPKMDTSPILDTILFRPYSWVENWTSCDSKPNVRPNIIISTMKYMKSAIKSVTTCILMRINGRIQIWILIRCVRIKIWIRCVKKRIRYRCYRNDKNNGLKITTNQQLPVLVVWFCKWWWCDPVSSWVKHLFGGY